MGRGIEARWSPGSVRKRDSPVVADPLEATHKGSLFTPWSSGGWTISLAFGQLTLGG